MKTEQIIKLLAKNPPSTMPPELIEEIHQAFVARDEATSERKAFHKQRMISQQLELLNRAEKLQKERDKYAAALRQIGQAVTPNAFNSDLENWILAQVETVIGVQIDERPDPLAPVKVN